MDEFGCEKIKIESITKILRRDVLITLYCEGHFTYINLVDFYYRYIDKNTLLMLMLIATVFPICFVSISIIAEKFLSLSMQNISKTLKLSPSLAATTLIAFANGSPDILACYSYSNKLSSIFLSLGTLFGGFIFGSTLVISGVIFSIDHEIQLPKASILKELIFFSISIIITCIFGYQTKSGYHFLIALMIFYLLYIITTVLIEKSDRRKRQTQQLEDKEKTTTKKSDETITTRPSDLIYLRRESKSNANKLNFKMDDIRIDDQFSEDDDDEDNLTYHKQSLKNISYFTEILGESNSFLQNIVLLPILLISLATIPSSTNPFMKSNAKAIVITVSIPFILNTLELTNYNFIQTLIFGIITGLIILVSELTKFKRNLLAMFYDVVSVFASIAWIKIFSNVIIDLISFIAYYMSMPELILSVFLLSSSYTLIDFFNNRALAMQGNDVMGAIACYSSQNFNMYIGLSLGVFGNIINFNTEFDIFGRKQMSDSFNFERNPFNSHFIIFVISFSVLILIITFINFAKNNFVVKKQFGYLMISFYCIFLISSIFFGIHSRFLSPPKKHK